MSNLSSVRLSAAPVDVRGQDVGVMPDARVDTREGLERTLATHVNGPFLLTRLLRSSLEKSADGRVI